MDALTPPAQHPNPWADVPPPEGFRHLTPVEVRYGDIDMLWHVNNTRYFAFLEESRVRYAQEVLGWDGEVRSLNMILATTKLDFLTPIFWGDQVAVYARASRVGGKSLTFSYVIARRAQGDDGQPMAQPVAQGEAVVVAWDLERNTTRPLPDDWRARLLAYEPALATAAPGGN